MKRNYIFSVLFLIVLTSWSQEYRRMIASGEYTVQEIQAEAEAYFAVVGTERGKGYNPYKRWEYNAVRNMDENGMLKTPDFYFNELENYSNYINQNSSQFRTTGGAWEQLGPTSWNATSGWNPGVGRITAIAVDDSNTDHIIIGGQTGGVWKTADGGVNWTVLTDNLSNINVYALAMDPTNSSTYFWGSTSGSIFKSIDAGATWNLLADTGSGNVNKILIDPTDTSKMYCSVEGGGIYKSTDSGVNWSLINASATNGYDVEFKPGDTNTIYASGNSFYKSTDGGLTFNSENTLPLWTQEFVSGGTSWDRATSNQNGTVSPKTGSGLALFYLGGYSAPSTRLVSPSLDISGATSPELKFSYTQAEWLGDQDELRVLYKTSAAGTWVELANYTSNVTSWSDIVLSLPNPSSDYYIAFEGTANYGYGITLDDVSVEDISLGIVFQDGFESVGSSNEFGTGPKMIGVSADNPSVVYVLEASGGTFGGFHRSTDSGDTFTKLNHGTNNYFGYESDASDNLGQAPRDMDIAVNPNNVDEVHIAGILTWRSIDGGTSFNVTSQWTPNSANAQNIGYCHADVDIMLFSGSELYVGTDGGIFVAENTSTVSSSYYTDLTVGLGIRQFYKIGVSQTDPEVVTGGSQDNGTSVMDTSGNWIDWLGADGFESFVDKDDNNVLYGSIYYGSFYKSINGGVSYSGLSSPGSGNWVTPFEQDPILSSVLYAGFSNVYKSINGGGSWAAISQNFGGNLDHLKIAPSDNLTMYASRGSSLYKTNDGGATNWTTLTGFSGSINSIAIHPSDPNKVAIATTGTQKVYVSVDGGTSWTSYLNDLPNFSALALVWQNNATDGLYVGMNYGVYYIDSTFTNWQPFINNLPNVMISELEINTANNKIYAGTYGRGLWRSDLFDATLTANDFEFQGLVVSPNPANIEIELKWNSSEEVNIKIYNSQGKLVYFNKNQNLLNSHNIDISKYSSGLYFVRIYNSKGEITKKIIKQ